MLPYSSLISANILQNDRRNMSENSRGEKSSKEKGTESEGKAGGDGDANILPAEAFTHGGVRKTKFEPKVPTRRLKKLSAVKRESDDGDDGELPGELQRLIKQSQEDAAGFRRRQDHKAPVRVAFGFGSTTAGRAAAGSLGFSRARAGSGGGGGGGGGGAGGGGSGGIASRKNFTFVIDDDEPYMESKSVKKKIAQESLDYTKYYPVTLPLRRPRSGVAELLDEEEFGEGHEYVEDAIPAAQELGLLEESAEDKFMFFQLPSVLPVDVLPPAEVENGSNDPSSGDLISLDMLPEGFLGKLLIYESGAVKLRLGDVVLDAMPGTNCVFAQELAAVNPVAKHCLFLGDINRRVVLTPDIDRLLSKSVDVS